jgi:hypothetical protein
VAAYDAGSHTASLRLDGSSPQTVTGVAVSHGIAGAAVTAGRRAIVDRGDSGEAGELVVVAVYG